PGVFVFDLGQNIVGWCRMRLEGPAGREVVLRHAEVLNPDGTIYTANLRTAQQVDRCVLRGGGEETFEPRFTYHGFRYVEVTGLERRPEAEDLAGCVIHSDAPPAGSFECSSPLLTRLWRNIRWTQRGNLHSVPTDCPQRDERLGWLGDAQVFSQTACFQMDMARFFSKWLGDIRDAQATDGRFPDFAPHPFEPDVRFSGVPAWGDAGVIVPWRVFVNYADRRVVEDHYDASRRWIDYVRSQSPDLIWTGKRGNDYNDWLSGDTLILEGYPQKGASVPKEVFATAFFARSTEILAKMAAVLGRDDDAERYADLAREIRRAFCREFMADDGRIHGDTQAGYALALWFDLAPEDLRPRLAEHLVRAVHAYGGRLSTGIQSTIRLMLALAEEGHTDLAYRLALRRDPPSWGYMIDQGATTIWERWDGHVEGRGFQDAGMNSFNHYALGSVGEWMVRAVLGLEPDEERPGYQHFRVRPRPGGGITWARCTYDSVRGPIDIRWKEEADRVRLEVSVPPGAAATVHVPHPAASAAAAGAIEVLEGSGPAAEAPGVDLAREEEGASVFRVASGTYVFTARLRRADAARPEPEVGILDAELPEEPYHASAAELDAFLTARGIACRILSAADLSSAEALRPEAVDIVILPRGDLFPLAAREPFIDYLKRGGGFVALGGYAFDRLLAQESGGWRVIDDPGPERYLSGRRGRSGDSLRLRPEQIAVFDPTYTFERIASMGRDPASPLPGLDWSIETSLSGFAATAMSGSNNPVFPRPHARWYPLATASDRYGRPRGCVLAMMLHHDGPYRGSAWAFSGVTSENLFSPRHPALLDALARAIEAMRLRTFLVSVELDDPGEGDVPMRARSRVANFGRRAQAVEVSCAAGAGSSLQQVSIAPGEIVEVVHGLQRQGLTADYCPIEVRLRTDGVFDDRLSTAWVSRRRGRTAIRSLGFQENYLRLDGEPRFLLGSNQTGMIWFSPRENPATWEEDLARMRDHGLRILRVLHFSPFAARGYEGQGGHSPLDLARPPPALLVRQTDQLVRMCARHGVALFLALHDWLPVTLSGEELEAQRTWARFWGGRYRGEPHVFFDVQNEPAVPVADDRPHVVALWNRFLGERYGGDAALREAWGRFAPEEPIGSVPPGPGPAEWENPRAAAHDEFRAWLLERWIDANARGVREAGSGASVTVGFLQFATSADKWLPTAALTFSNTHYHGPVENLSPILKLTDLRCRGQGLSLGEFGAWDAHGARTRGRFADDTRSATRHILAAGHETLGLGGSFALNWDLKDLDDCIFPWGLTHAQDRAPKGWLPAYRNLALLTSGLRPRYEPPAVFLVLPDAHRLGARSGEIHDALLRAVRLLFAAHVDFAVIPETSLAHLPPEASALLWPLPCATSDRVFDSVLRFVEEGGSLYLSGGAGFDEHRRPASGERLARLGLAPRTPRSPFAPRAAASEGAADVEVELSTAGRGKVFFVPEPLELRASTERGLDDRAVAIYRSFLQRSSIAHHRVEPRDALLHIFSIPEGKDRAVYTLYREEKDAEPREYSVETPAGEVRLSLRCGETGLIHCGRGPGEILALEGAGELRVGRELLAEVEGHAMLQSLDGAPLARSRGLLLLPAREGAVRLRAPSIAPPVAVVGEFRRRRWTELERWRLPSDGDAIRIEVDTGRAGLVLMVADEDALPELERRLEERLQ
ncbi:MAG: family 78 glycoside hydrolase catalytic domain, partial [Planctomycetes bacterium]|nr:family 78 glycoside hydrolase catalytic domain [Planctomycetota bacterium]